ICLKYHNRSFCFVFQSRKCCFSLHTFKFISCMASCLAIWSRLPALGLSVLPKGGMACWNTHILIQSLQKPSQTTSRDGLDWILKQHIRKCFLVSRPCTQEICSIDWICEKI
ncbi:hypothetical protein SKAU_G00127430, partial [Synaphobranchus kaupii]